MFGLGELYSGGAVPSRSVAALRTIDTGRNSPSLIVEPLYSVFWSLKRASGDELLLLAFLLLHKQKIKSEMMATMATTPPIAAPTITPVFTPEPLSPLPPFGWPVPVGLVAVPVELAPSLAYTANWFGLSKNAGTRSPLGHFNPCSLHALVLQQPQNVVELSGETQVRNPMLVPQDASGGKFFAPWKVALKETGLTLPWVQPCWLLHGSLTQQPTNLETDDEGQAYHFAPEGQVGSKKSIVNGECVLGYAD